MWHDDPDGADVERQFVRVAGREVLLRRHGSGAPVLLLADAPRSSASLNALTRRLGRELGVVAPDLPGTGLSDPLPSATPGLDEYADALAATLTALGIARCPVYGQGSGAHLALELDRRHPERVTGLVLDGLERDADARDWDHHPEHPPVLSGSHLLDVWAQVREGFLFSPRHRPDRAHRVRRTVPPAAVLHAATMDILRAGPAGPAASRAAAAQDVAAALSRPDRSIVLVHAAEAPPSATPPAGPTTTSAPLPADPGAARERIATLVTTATDDPAPSPAVPAPAAPTAADPDRVTRELWATAHGRLLVRELGAGEGPPLLLLHGSPGGAHSVLPLARELAHSGPVITVDTLGNGDSDKPDWTTSAIADYAAVLAEALDAQGLGPVDLFGTHTGGSIALELAIARPDLVRALVLDGVGLYDEAERREHLARYTAYDLQPRPDGTHLLEAWHMMRNATLFWPWYRGTPDAVRDVEPYDAERLHALVLDLLRSGPTYRLAYRAAFWHQTADRLPLAEAPALLLTDDDDVLRAPTLAAAGLLPHGDVAVAGAAPAAKAIAIRDFLDRTAAAPVSAGTAR